MTTKQWFRLGVLGVAAFAVSLTVGCAKKDKKSETPELPKAFLQEDWPQQEVPVAHIVRRDYRLREGDSLEIIYHIRHQETQTYLIKTEDIIQIRFPFQPSLNQTEQVQSDGNLYLDLVGRVKVAGESIQDLTETLKKEYGKYIKDPQLTVSFKQSNVKIEELKKAIVTAPRGMSRLVPITPDGTISLPYIVDIRASGLTISELHRALNASYREIGLEELEVTVNLQNVAPQIIYVMGEVRIPGALLNKTGAINASSEVTLLQAIAQSGSYIPQRAELSKVMLIRRRHLPRPQIAIINVFQLLENRKRQGNQPVVADSSKYRYDLYLEDGDIIYVPTNDIARRADYIEYVWTRGIRAVGGFTSNYTVTDYVDWLKPN